MVMREPPARACVVVDTPRFSYIKRRDDGRIDFVSPLPCPFNYGSVPGTLSGDGERIDAVVLGPRRARHSRAELAVVGLVRFCDAGQDDPKWICSDHPFGALEQAQVRTFFQLYAALKRGLNAWRGRSGATCYEGLELRSLR
jgi:inorganic pyrophosphatase